MKLFGADLRATRHRSTDAGIHVSVARVGKEAGGALEIEFLTIALQGRERRLRTLRFGTL